MGAFGEPSLIEAGGKLRKPLGYAMGVALFACAFAATSASLWFRIHFPYVGYFVASTLVCYVAGLGPAILVSALSAIAVYFTFTATAGGFFVGATRSPLSAAVVVLVLFLWANWALGSLKTSRDRLALERQRYADLAESRGLLYREMQHRVSNNIAVAASLLMMQSQTVEDGPAKRALTEAAGRISLIGQIQRRLLDQSGVPAPFRRFAEELIEAAIDAAGAERVRFEIEGGEEPLHRDQTTPVCLVLLECVNNALEHGFGAGRRGLIRVSYVREGGEIRLIVHNDGLGLPEGFELEAAGTLGLTIVRALAGQLGGAFSISAADPGTVCRLNFPVRT